MPYEATENIQMRMRGLLDGATGPCCIVASEGHPSSPLAHFLPRPGRLVVARRLWVMPYHKLDELEVLNP